MFATQEQIDKRLDLKIFQQMLLSTDRLQLRTEILLKSHNDNAWRDLFPSETFSECINMHKNKKNQLNQDAIRKLVDYYFELHYLPTLSLSQAHDYFSVLENKCDLVIEDIDGPVILESIHHRLAFSASFCAVKALIKQLKYQRIIMLHQHEKPDARLLIIRDIFASLGLKDLYLVRLHGTWFREVKRRLTTDTIIFTMGDMPANVNTEKNTTNKNNTLFLDYPDGVMSVPVFSLAKKIAPRLNAKHLIMNYTLNGRYQVKNINDHPFYCQLDDWIFWPAINTLFSGSL